ncbi:MAG: hypothetical protein V2I46_06870 [Bacteroides sp.]|jgi:hypothetical protein|nr:hypothetical protein [Bacteroides sp.]
MAANFEILLDKLDQFIRRYYLNLLIKGALLFGAGFLLIFLVFSLLEYFGYFGSLVRSILFYGFLAFNLFVLVRYVLRPLAGFMRIGKRISAPEAARIVGEHFRDEIRDKITNTLELRDYLEDNPEGKDLILAGINQKSGFALQVPFLNAIDFKGNTKYLPYFLIPFVIFLGIVTVKPAFLFEPASRIARYDVYFEKPAPFSFQVENELQGFQGEDLVIEALSPGSVLPADAMIRYGGGEYLMQGDGKGLFTHKVRNLQETFQFFIHSQGFEFGPFELRVLQKPAFSHFTVKVENPGYTGLGKEEFSNIGDLMVAEGARVHWEFYTRGSGSVSFFLEGEEQHVEEMKAGVFQVNHRAGKSFNYEVFAWNDDIGKGDSLQYFVQVKPDAWPQIQIEEQQDSVLLSHLFFRGLIQDDFGFTDLEFRYRLVEDPDLGAEDEKEFIAEKLVFDPELLNQTFYHHFDLQSIYINPGESVEYYFIVFDNDGVNGSKSSRSRLFSFYVPSEEELLAQSRKSNEQFKDDLDSGISEVRDSRRKIDQIRKQMLENERLNWDQREALEQLLEKQHSIQENFEELKEIKERNELRDEQFMETSERIKEKQEELDRLYEEVVSDELKELMEKIRQELDSLNREQVYQMLEEMEFEMSQLENQMDRALEFFKQLELERLLQQSLDKLEAIKEEQDEQIENTGAADLEDEQIIENQENINEDLENLSEMLEEFREKNQDLQRPQPIDNTSELEKSIMEDLQKALEQMQQGQRPQSSGNQQSGRKKMDDLSMRLESMQQSMFEDQLAEDARALRVILENLLKSSFSQENLLLEVRNINVNDPQYVELIQDQKKIQEDLQMIEDSLVALSKRQMQIGAYVNREIGEINMNLARGLDELVNRRRYQGASRQQFVMTHINNLALLLNESLQNMQMQMSMNSSGNPENSGGGQCDFPGLRQMQEQLNRMLEQLQQGHQPMPGESGKPMSVSEQLARLAAEQEAIRNQLKELADEMKAGGEDGRALDQLMRDMERTELDIVNRNVTRQTVQRQQRILTRLLEHERAQLQREQEERREATTAKNYEISNPVDVFEYNRIRNRELEMLRSLPPGLKPYYRSLVETYFLNVE